jgi:hypothetical protein
MEHAFHLSRIGRAIYPRIHKLWQMLVFFTLVNISCHHSNVIDNITMSDLLNNFCINKPLRLTVIHSNENMKKASVTKRQTSCNFQQAWYHCQQA